MTRIDLSEVTFEPSVDRNGFVFFWKNRIFRAIYPDKEKAIQELFDCGLIDELVKKNLFPKTTKTDYVIDKCSMVLEHARISPVLLPDNWSFEMYKDACLCLLTVNRIASAYGYTTIDSHGYNILFSGIKPKFVDLGSFIKSVVIKPGKVKGWRGLREFTHRMYLPLKIKAANWEFYSYDQYSFSIMKAFWGHPVLVRLLTRKQYELLDMSFYNYKMIHQVPDDVINDYLKSTPGHRWLAKMILFGKRWNLFPFTSLSFSKLEKRVGAIKKRQKKSTRAGEEYDEIKNIFRVKKLIELINALPDCETVLDLSVNSSVFSIALAENTVLKKIICTDCNANALDKLYAYLKKTNEKRIIPVLLNIREDVSNASGQQFRSDLVCALKYHLFLSQGVSSDFILRYLKNNSKKYVAIEFMALELYKQKYNNAVVLPDGYSEEWFVKDFKKYFSVISITSLEENRTLYIGKVHP